jgi:RNA polymerase sigma-70 factor (ECF subfamily)
VLVLRDVLGFSARETAEMLDTTSVSVDSALQRAHASIRRRIPPQSQQATVRQLGDAALRDLVDRFVAAWERHDVDALVALLTEDARLTMPPLPSWFSGRDAVAGFLRGWPLAGTTEWRLVPTSANAQIAFGGYYRDRQTGTFTAHEITVLTLRGPRIEEITAFLHRLPHPRRLPALRPAGADCGLSATASCERELMASLR